MEIETSKPSDLGSPQGEDTSGLPPTTRRSPDSDLRQLFGEAAKYTVFAAFASYVFGFVIWHSYLGSFGVSSVGFLQTEYFSAAICYIVVTVSLGVPPALLLARMHSSLRETPERQAEQNKSRDAIHVVLFAWFAVSNQLMRVLFPSDQLDAFSHVVPLQIVLVGVALIYFGVQMAAFLTFMKSKTEQSRKLYENLRKVDVSTYALAGYGLVILLSTTGLNKLFFLYTTFIYSLFSYNFGVNVRALFFTASRPLKVVVATFFGLMFVTHLQMFGASQFGKIPRQVGGGKPETAYLKFGTNQMELVSSLNLPIITNLPILKGFVGPISILLKSDKEIVFINEAELSLPEFFTNETMSVSTNFSTGLVTNFHTSVLTHTNGIQTTNVVTEVLRARFQTNIVNISKTPIKNLTKLSAKQVRADLLEAIIFSK
jgi:hypothetical protein